ncbi:MAG: ArsR/SmtB family transcription factor [Acidiferrobacterales bacterium]
MKVIEAVQSLGALAQETRLAVFRLLVKAGPAGLAAGVIAERMHVTPATLSFHLKELERAGLLTARRESRQIYYMPNFSGMRDLLSFLTEDCCRGRPEVCSPRAPSDASGKRAASAGRRQR